MSPTSQTSADGEEVKRTLVPKLRFPEFRGAKWVQKKLEDVAPLQRGFDLPSDLIRLGDIPIVYSNGIQKYHEVGMATAPGLVTGRSGTIGKLHFIEHGEYWPHNTSLWVTDFKGNNPRFVYYLYGSIGMSRFSSGSGVPTLNRNDVHAFNAPIPNSTDEQQKIAKCLSSVDELIAAQARKVDALKTHKKGLMQQLFPREGETQPRLRFPEFQNAGEWEVKRLEQIGRVIRGASPRPKGDSRYYGGLVPRLMVQDVTRDGKWVTPQIDSLTEEGARLSRPCPAGTLTIVCSGSVGVVSFLAVDACIHDGFLALVDIDESIATKDFLFHTLSTLREQFEKGATHGGVFTNLTTTGIDLFEIKRPGIPEQQRIATCLSNLDSLITAETQKLETLKTHKKGLMQQLFPSPEETLP
jgi:type I restriction enzyme S subunit